MEIPERRAILSPWLLEQSLCMLYAWRGVGKTFVALNVAYAVATGGKFLNWHAERPRKVLYLDGEMPASALQRRLKDIVLADERDFDPSFLRIVTPDTQDGRPVPDLATAEGRVAIEAILGDAELIIVDNVSTLVRTMHSENDAESWRDVQAWALQMRQQGRAVLFVHHSGKNREQRGSSKREDTLDVSISLKRPADYLPEQGARFEIHFEKYRNGAGDEAKSIEASIVIDAQRNATWTYRDVEDSTFDRVVSLANEGLPGKEIAGELGLNKGTVSRHMSKARAAGLIPGKRA